MDISDFISVIELWGTLSNFVSMMCEGRDESHGYYHMEKVAMNTLEILKAELDPSLDITDAQKIITDCITVAWLHDVADHKYDKDGKLKLKVLAFVRELLEKQDEVELVMKIIDHISYSKENNAIKSGKPIDFEKELGKTGAFIRHIVSDADKLEALGRGGFIRMVEYTRQSYKERNNKEISESELNKQVTDHSNEKLLRLKDYFIKTRTGRDFARIKHQELVEELAKLNH